MDANKKTDKAYQIEYSVGVAHFQHDTNEPIEKMIQAADNAMFQDKKGSGIDSDR
jgi:PleD family two-component response regulator